MVTDSAESDVQFETAADTTYDPLTETAQTTFDGGTDSVVVAVVEAVATVTGSEVTAMPPLFASVDPEALSSLVERPRGRAVTVSFFYEGCRVTVSGDGDVTAELTEQ